jgi:hypothetical protein
MDIWARFWKTTLEYISLYISIFYLKNMNILGSYEMVEKNQKFGRSGNTGFVSMVDQG